MLHTTSNSILRTTPRRQLRNVAVALVAALAILGPSTAQAKTQHRYTSVIESLVLSSGGGYPAPGGTAILVGSWATSLLGTGALIDHLTITGHPTPATFTFRATETGFLALGTFNDVFTGTATVEPNGAQKVSAKGRVIGGTGAYRGAKGSFTFNGATAPGSTLLFGHSAGTVSY
jgi:hypothetical protein